MPRSAKPAAKPLQVFKFKITLRDIKPPIWRRIQMPDGTLDDLHLAIQAGLGWTNTHLHHFLIGDDYYGDPDLLEGELDLIDSTKTRLSKLLRNVGRSFRFRYEYDFGDSWEHDVVFEGCAEQEAGVAYPRCTGGARARPPEDIGGAWGYADFLEALRDPKNPVDSRIREWLGDEFDSESFDADAATRQMQIGVPDWRAFH